MTACTRHESKEKTMKFKILVLTTLAVLLTACVAPLQKEQTKALLDEGIALYQKQDYQHAKPYFEQAQQAGHMKAPRYLGLMYLNGEGVAQNAQTALPTSRRQPKRATLPGNTGWAIVTKTASARQKT